MNEFLELWCECGQDGCAKMLTAYLWEERVVLHIGSPSRDLGKMTLSAESEAELLAWLQARAARGGER